MIRQATLEHVPDLITIYEEAMRFSDSKGHPTGWTNIPTYLPKLVEAGELWVSADDSEIARGGVRLTEGTNPQEWPNGNEGHLLIAKLATGDATRQRSQGG